MGYRQSIYLFSLSLAAVAAVLLVGLGHPERALAEQPGGITLGPVLFDFALHPGQTELLELRLNNGSQHERHIRLYAEAFGVRGEEYHHEYGAAVANNPADWIEFEAERYVLEPGEAKEVPFMVRVPAGITPGGYYAVIFVETLPTPGSERAVQQNIRIGSLVYVEAAGTIRKEGGLGSFSSRFWQHREPLRSSLRISNSGGSHFRTFGWVRYSGLFGRYERSVTGVILPDTVRKFEVEAPNLPYGLYWVSGSVELLDEDIALPGRLVLFMPLTHAAAILVLAGLITLFYRRHYNIRARRGTATGTQA